MILRDDMTIEQGIDLAADIFSKTFVQDEGKEDGYGWWRRDEARYRNLTACIVALLNRSVRDTRRQCCLDACVYCASGWPMHEYPSHGWHHQSPSGDRYECEAIGVREKMNVSGDAEAWAALIVHSPSDRSQDSGPDAQAGSGPIDSNPAECSVDEDPESFTGPHREQNDGN